MNAIKAIFNKQLADLPKNMSVTMMFILFPLMSLLLGTIMGGGDEIAESILNMQFMMIFAAMTPMVMIANTIAEDNEYKSLRFMVTAGVKPGQYLMGLISFAMIISTFPVVAFAFIGGYSGTEFWIFIALGLAGCLASCILGAIVGIFSKNVQQSSALYTPLGMVLAFTPMVAMGSEAVRNVVQYLFPVQIFVTLFDMLMPEYTAVLTRVNIEGYDIMHRFVGEYVLEPIEPLSQGMTTSLIIIGANAVVFAILFAIAYKRKGLKG